MFLKTFLIKLCVNSDKFQRMILARYKWRPCKHTSLCLLRKPHSRWNEASCLSSIKSHTLKIFERTRNIWYRICTLNYETFKVKLRLGSNDNSQDTHNLGHEISRKSDFLYDMPRTWKSAEMSLSLAVK